MRQFNLKAITAVATWAVSSACHSLPVARGWMGDAQPRAIADIGELEGKLSPAAKIFYPGSDNFTLATTRWSVLDAPHVNIVVVPGTANDVAETVKFANKVDLPFIAFNGAHGATTTLGKLDHGIQIYLSQLSGVKVAKDGKTARIGGGTISKLVTDELWAAGKQTVTGTCECVGYLGPALGGGHGWLQGHHGLVADQFVSADIVLADGSAQTIDAGSDLWYALNGAGHNFGIVTSVTTKVYDIKHPDWAIETFIFSGDKVEAVYQAANDHLLQDGKQPEGLINWSYWLNIPTADPKNPIILFYVIQEGVKAVDSIYVQPFRDIGPLSADPQSGTYKDLAAWTGIDDAAPPCQNAGLANPRFPIYLQEYNVPAQKEAYDLFASSVQGASLFNGSLFLFEGYSMQGVQAIKASTTAFAFRSEHLLAAPLITYTPAGAEVDEKAAALGNKLRQILHKGSGRKNLRAYVNYSFGNETPEQLYGHTECRQRQLRDLKNKYDPEGKFSYYAPVA